MGICENCGHPAFARDVNNRFMVLHGKDGPCVSCRKKWAKKCPVKGCDCDKPSPITATITDSSKGC